MVLVVYGGVQCWLGLRGSRSVGPRLRVGLG